MKVFSRLIILTLINLESKLIFNKYIILLCHFLFG